MASRAIAKWVVDLQPGDIPADVWTAARRSFYNYLGCAVAGHTHEAVTKAYDALEPFFGARTCSVLGSNGAGKALKADALHAALLNGIASHVHDYDDTHLDTIIHPTGPVASALVAYSQRVRSTHPFKGVSGEQLLLALIAGIEVECKVGLAVWPRHYDVGWHITGTVGSIGAAVGVCKLMLLTGTPLSEDAVIHAIGVSATQVTGLREMFGSDTKSFHVGRAAQNGLTAAILAAKGFTSSERPLEANRGWCNVVCDTGSLKLSDYVAQLGQPKQWEIEKNTFKPFPCGIVKHPAIDAAIRLHKQIEEKVGKDGLLAALKKLSFMALVHPLVLELTGKREPQDGLQAKFSVYHGIAVGLLYGEAGPQQYTDQVVTSEHVRAVSKLINSIGRPDVQKDEVFLHALDPENPPTDGKFPYSIHVEHAVGSIAAPMTETQLAQKFESQVSITHNEQATKAMSIRALSVQAEDDVGWWLGDL